MRNMEKVNIQWFDELKGIGEGVSSKGDIVFLNVDNMAPDNKFLTLKKGEYCFCRLEKSDDQFYASSIQVESTGDITVERGTFLAI